MMGENRNALHRIEQRQRGHGVLAHPGHKIYYCLPPVLARILLCIFKPGNSIFHFR